MRRCYGKGVALMAVSALAMGMPAQAQSGTSSDNGQGGDQTRRNLTPPPQPPPAPPPNFPPRSGFGLGGVKMKLPSPLSNKGSLLEKRMWPPPQQVAPTAPASPNIPSDRAVVVHPGGVPVYDSAWILRQRGVATGGVSIEIGSDGVRRFRLQSPSPVGVYLVREDSWWKYPGTWYRSPWRYRDGTGWCLRDDTAAVGACGSRTSDAFLTRPVEMPDYLNPESELTELDRAELAMAAADWKAAIEFYTEQVALAPNDAGSMRMLGLALVLDGKVREGVLSMALAYERDPKLAGTPINVRVLRDEGAAHVASSAIMNHALRAKTWEGFLAGAAIKQALGAKSVAVKMLDKAQAAGLKGEIEGEMRKAFGAWKP